MAWWFEAEIMCALFGARCCCCCHCRAKNHIHLNPNWHPWMVCAVRIVLLCCLFSSTECRQQCFIHYFWFLYGCWLCWFPRYIKQWCRWMRRWDAFGLVLCYTSYSNQFTNHLMDFDSTKQIKYVVRRWKCCSIVKKTYCEICNIAKSSTHCCYECMLRC